MSYLWLGCRQRMRGGAYNSTSASQVTSCDKTSLSPGNVPYNINFANHTTHKYCIDIDVVEKYTQLMLKDYVNAERIKERYIR